MKSTNTISMDYVDWLVFHLSKEMNELDTSDLSALDGINPALTRYGRKEPAPVLPLREEPDLLSWLEASGRLVTDDESTSPEISTVEEEELSALMGEKEDYKAEDEQSDEEWEEWFPQSLNISKIFILELNPKTITYKHL